MFHLSKKREVAPPSFATPGIPLTIEQQGTYARQALNNPIFQMAFDELRNEALRLWESCESNQIEKREFVWIYLKALNQLKGRVERYISNALYQDSLNKRQAPETEQRN